MRPSAALFLPATLLLLVACGDKDDPESTGSGSGDDTATSGGDDGGSDEGGTDDGGDEGGTDDGGDEGGDEGGTDDGGDDGGEISATWTEGVYPLIARDCLGCHSYWGSSAEEVHAELTSFESPDYGPYITAGDPDASYFFDKVANDTPVKGVRMPISTGPMFEEDIALIGDWIDAGAAQDATWDEEVFRVLGGGYRCVQCHGDEWGMGPGDVYDTLLNGTYGEYALVEPGDKAASGLYLKLTEPPSGDIMPPEMELWSDEEVGAFRTWIEDGAVLD